MTGHKLFVHVCASRSSWKENVTTEPLLKLKFATKLVNLTTFKPSLMLSALKSVPGIAVCVLSNFFLLIITSNWPRCRQAAVVHPSGM